MEQSIILDTIINKKVIPALEKSFKENLASVLIYGSVARNNYRKEYSDINLLILLNKNNPEAVINFGRTASGIIKKHRLTPLIMTEKEFTASADVFPMEYSDIKDSYILLKGDDPVQKLRLTDKNLRHQTESSLRGIINQTRQYITASKGSRRFLTIALKKMSGSIESVLRGSLRLKKEETGNLSRKDIIEKTAEVYSLDKEAGLRLIDAEKGSIFEDTAAGLSFLTSLTEKIDEMDF